MKCPFVDRDCIGRECAAWSNGMCFVENFAQKLDTLCNLISKLSVDLSNKSSFLELSHKESELEPDQTRTTISELGKESKQVLKETVNFYPFIAPRNIGEATIAVDFGTALSKVAVKPSFRDFAIPIPLAGVASKILADTGTGSIRDIIDNDFVEDSMVYIDDEGYVFCGSSARSQYLQALGHENTRPAIQNLKQFLIGGGPNFAIHDSHFPTPEKLGTQEVLAIYLAYLLRLTRTYIGSVEKLTLDLDSALRNFSIPVWEDKKYREEVKDMMKRAIAKAYCLEQWLKDDLVKGAPLLQLREALEEAKKHETELQFIFGTEVTEPVAAGYNRVLGLDIEPGWLKHIFIVDAGAGSTDFALLMISRSREAEKGLIVNTHKQAGVDKGVSMWDNGVRALLYQRVAETAGVTQGHPTFQLFNAKLNLNLRSMKEKVIESEDGFPIDVSPILTTPIRISRAELESSRPVQDAISVIRDGFKKYIKEVQTIIPKDKFDPSLTEFLVTGGGSFVPSIVECIRECARLFGPSYQNKVEHRYLPSRYKNFTSVYPMLAVSLGSTEREYPAEQMITPIELVPGTFVLDKY